MGTLSPYPWDLSLSGEHASGSSTAAPAMPAPRTALRSHPCVAVSSAGASPSIDHFRAAVAETAAGTL